MDPHDQDAKQLVERLAGHGLKATDGDVAALLPAIADLEASSVALRRNRPYALEPLSAFRLTPRKV